MSAAAQLALFAGAVVAATPAEWQRIDARPWTKCGARWQHRDGWRLEHCGHPTALYPWALFTPAGEMVCTGAEQGKPDCGTAWPNLDRAKAYVRTQAPIAIGEELFAILRSKKTKSGRSNVEGAARVVVVNVDGDRIVARVIAGDAPAGARVELARTDAYRVSDKDARKTFGEIVKRYWSGSYRGEGRK